MALRSTTSSGLTHFHARVYRVSDQESPKPEQGWGFGFARVLHGLGDLLGGDLTGHKPDTAKLGHQVDRLAERLEAIEDRFQSYRLEIQRMCGEMEATLADTTKRYAKARAAESRANREDGPPGTDSGIPDLTRDPEGYRAWLARGGIAGG